MLGCLVWLLSVAQSCEEPTRRGLSPGFIQGTGPGCSWGFGVGSFLGRAEKTLLRQPL